MALVLAAALSLGAFGSPPFRGPGGGNPPIPPSGGDYGPTNGRDWVVDNAGPRAVENPNAPGQVSFSSRATLQAAIDANPIGTTFVHAIGGTESWDAQINCVTKEPKVYFLGLSDSTATIVDGGGANIQGFSSTAGSGFEIHGGTLTGFGDATTDTASISAIRMNGPGVIEDVTVHTCRRGATVTMDGDNSIVRRCKFRDNRRYGLSLVGDGPDDNRLLGVTVEHNIIRNNNTLQLDPSIDAGGTKFLSTTNLICRFNHVLNNHGFGLWLDAFHESAIVEENVTEANFRGGYFLEFSRGGNIFRRNASYRDCETNTETVTRHTRTALLVTLSNGTEGPGGGNLITRNIVDTTQWPIHLFDSDARAKQMTDCDIIANDFYLRSSSSRIGGQDNKATQTMHNDATLTWSQNRYNVLSTATEHWYWPNGTAASEQLSFAEWEAKAHTTDETRVLI